MRWLGRIHSGRWGGVEPPDRLRQAQALEALEEVQHVAALAAAEAVPALGVAVHREAALALFVEGADALADAPPATKSDTRSFHHPGRYVGGEPQAEAASLDEAIEANLRSLGSTMDAEENHASPD